MFGEKNSEITKQLFIFLVKNREKLLEEIQKSYDETFLIDGLLLKMGRGDCYGYVMAMTKREFKKTL
jgi:hypothetical protein